MDEVEFIQRVLCRLDLPDREVYPALARIRDARLAGYKPEIQKALSSLALVFTIAVRQGLDKPPRGWNIWRLLSNQRELRSDPELRDLLDYLVAYRSYRDSWLPPSDGHDEGGLGVGARRRPRPPGPGYGDKRQFPGQGNS